jgi:alpha/beta superfamily hydrolase
MSEEQAVNIQVPAGPRLEGRLAVGPHHRGGVIVCHPHPLYGGDMDNPVVVAAARAALASGLATLRFNFRGVGGSGGRHDGGDGECHDTLAARAFLSGCLPAAATIWLAGYSFGAWVAASIAEARGATPLCLIAPPLAMVDLPPLPADPGHVLVLAGTQDAYCPLPAVERLAAACPGVQIVTIEGTDHFFSGALDAVSEAVTRWVRSGPGSKSGDPAREAGGGGGAG